MAVVLPGPLVSDVRGGVGDLVFERNAGGLYVRSKGIVTQDVTDPRTAAHDALTYLSRRYRDDLTEAQRQAWSQYGRIYPTADRWGQPKPRTGQQAYIRFNFHCHIAFGCEWGDTAPTLPPLPKTTITGEGNVANAEIDIATPFPDWDVPATPPVWYIYQGPMMSLQRSYFSGPYRFAGTYDPGGPGWPSFIFVSPAFTLTGPNSFWIKMYYQQDNPTRESRPTIARFLTVSF